MKTIFVTGCYGFIGRHLARHLSDAGNIIGGVGHGVWPPSEAARWGVRVWVNGTVGPANLDLLVRELGRPDLIFHLAGGSSVGTAILNPREDFFRTVASTVELLDWTRQRSGQSSLVAVSSAAVYGAGHDGVIAETAALRPYSPYGHHKHIMEELCRYYGDSYGASIAIARLFSVYGAGLKKQLLWDLCAQLERAPSHVSLGGTGEELRDWSHVTDVVRALAEIGQLASPEVPTVNVGTGQGTSVAAIARQLIAHWSGTADEPALAFSGVSRPGDPFNLVAAGDVLDGLGFKWERKLDEGLAEYVAWYRARSQDAL